MLVLIWSIALLAALWLYLQQVYSRFKKNGIKHLKPVPILGNMSRVTFRMEHFANTHERVYNAFPKDRFSGMYEFLNPLVVINDLELIKKVTVKDFEHFLNHRALIDEKVEPFFGRNIFALKDQKWKDMRSTLSPAFTSSKIRLMVPFMEEAGDQMISALKEKIKKDGVGYVDADCKDLMMRYANDVIASCAFGLKVDSHTEENNEFYEMGRAASTFKFGQLLKFFGYTAFPNAMKKLKVQIFSDSSRNFFKELVMSTMQNREKSNILRNDVIQLLMEAKKGQLTYDENTTKDVDAGFATVEESDMGKKSVTRVWCDEDLIAQAVLFFIAGFETISASMTFLLFELASNIEVQDKLVKEITDHSKKHNGKLDYAGIQQLTYLDMVVSELLRKWPAAIATDRVCTKNYNLGRPNAEATEDYIVRQGEGIIVPIWGIHRSAEYYPDPEKFIPERFDEENKHNIKPFTYLPFGVGPRNCIGSRFALCEIKAMTYRLLLEMEITPCEKTHLPIKLSTESFNLRIKGGHWLRIFVTTFNTLTHFILGNLYENTLSQAEATSFD